MDLFVVPTIGFDLLYAFVIVRLDRRDLVWINVTTIPTSEWVARQITEAFPWNEAPRYMIRDRDRIYGAVVTRRLRAMGTQHNPQEHWTILAKYRAAIMQQLLTPASTVAEVTWKARRIQSRSTSSHGREARADRTRNRRRFGISRRASGASVK
jgi:hypothetical protein